MIIFTELTHVFLRRLLILVTGKKTVKEQCVITDLHCVLETVVELHLNAPVFCHRVQDHPHEQLPHALEDSVTRQQTQ